MNKKTKTLGELLLVVFLLGTVSLKSQITKLPECNTGVPHFNIDLSSDPDSMYITPEVERAKQCCGNASSNENYVSFYVKAHPDVAMIEVDIYSGANPPGDAAKYNVITGGDSLVPGSCGSLIDAGSPTCVTLDASGYLKVTYYKPGKNKNRYYFKQIPKPIFPHDDSTRIGCSLPIEIFGLDNINITSINSSTGNTTLGAYNSLLSCTNCSNPSFSPGLSTPAWIDYQISGTPTAQACGTYTSIDTVRLYTFGGLTISASPNPASYCLGGSGVTLTATANGGNGVYTYKWRNSSGTIVSNTNTYLATTAGTYTAEVIDGLISVTCPAEYVSVPVVIGNPPSVDAGIDQTVCATSPTVFLSGTVQYATGGTWTGGSGVFSPSSDSLLTTYTPTATEIANGFVTLTLLSTGAGGGCNNSSNQITINFSDSIFVNPYANPMVCDGELTEIFSNALGGTAPLNYFWSNGATSSSITASAGTYSLMVSDFYGCTATSSITVSNPTPIILNLSSNNVSADSTCDGNATLAIIGGQSPYSVLWSNGETTLTTSNTLCYGIHNVTVTDDNGCIVNGSVVVNSPTCSAFNVTANSTDVDCYGGSNGTATANPVGGFAPYTYHWNTIPEQSNQTATNLSAGSYTVTVTDTVGCVDVAGVIILQPTIITNTITHIDVTTIGGTDGSATANPQGGTPPYQYLWSPGVQTTQTASNLNSAVGGKVYYLTVTDDNLCTIQDSVLINQPPCNNFIVAVNKTDASCNGLSNGSAYIVIAHGTAPYQIVWSHGPTNVTSVTGLSQGNYSVTVTDASNCTTFQNFTITEPDALSLGLVPTNVACFGDRDGTIDLTVSGGSFPYSYEWEIGGVTIAYHEDLVGLSPGTYSVSVTDENKCVTTASVGITQPAKLAATNTYVDNLCNGYSTGSINMTPSGGVLPYTYSWSGSSNYSNTTQDISGLSFGLYEFEFSDGGGCQSPLYQVYINQPDTIKIHQIEVSCPIPGASTTTVNVDSITGGSGGPYQISFDNQATFLPVGVYSTSLQVGNSYQVWAKDANGCLSFFAYSLIIDSNVEVDSVQFNPCFPIGTTNIPITVVPIGGDGGSYQISTDGGLTWNPSGVYSVNLPVNSSYNITVRDLKGCIAVNYPIVIPAELNSSIAIINQVSCLGASDGYLNLTTIGGTVNYGYFWTGPSGFNSSNEDVINLVVGTYYVTITDDKGCTKQDSIVLTTVLDTTKPVINCIANQTVYSSTSSCSYAVSGLVWDASATDNCIVTDVTYVLSGVTTGTGNSLDNISFNTGITNVLWTATDSLGNFSQCSYVVTVLDSVKPSFIMCGAGDQTVNVDSNQCNYTQTTTVWDATASDNCTNVTITATLSGVTTATGLTTLSGVNFNTGITTVLWTVTDTSGNSVTCSYDITVIDNITPSFIMCGAGDQTVNVDSNQCNYTQTTTVWDATASDNCTNVTITATLSGVTTATGLTTLSGVDFNTGITTVLWTVTDTSGNSVTCSYDVTVIDNISPSIIQCGAGNQTVNVDSNQCNYTQTTTVWDATASDNCTNTTITATLSGVTTATGLTTLSGVDFNTGITTVLWTVTDTSGNSVNCSYDVTVIDNILPSFIMCGAGNQTVNVDSNQCNYTQTTTVWDATASDNCTNVTITATLSGVTTATGLTTLAGVDFNTGITTVLWTVTDTSGNSVTCTYDITVIDTIKPIILNCGSGDQTVNVDSNQCNYTQTTTVWDATASDNCTSVTITATLSGVTTATGLTTLAGVDFNTGITTVLWTVTDTSGNSVTCSYDVTVIDNILPSFIMCGAGDQTVNVDSNQCNYTQTTTVWDATASDNCTNVTITATLSGVTTATGLTTLSGVDFNTGITTVLWTVTDTSGNSVTCTYDITVIDNITPSILTCGAGDQTVNVDSNQCNYTQTTTVWDATASDNCTNVTITATLSGVTTATGLTTLSGVDFNTGITTVLWTVTDTSGNSVTCTYDITVIDNISPSITQCGAGDQTVVSDSGVCDYTHLNSSWDATATDNCTVSSVVYTLSGATSGSGTTLLGVTFNLGLTHVLWSVTDTVGNIDTCSYNIEITDAELPIIFNCPTDIVVSNDNDSCGAVVSWITPTFTDNCGATLNSSHNSGDYFNEGTTTVIYTVTDASGNFITCEFDVTVNDTQAPTAICNNSIATCDSLVVFNNPTVDDNCGVQSFSQISGLTSGSIFPVGITTITFEVIDIHNNTAQCSFDVTVHPTPVVVIQTEDVSCNGFNDGSIDLSATNGTTPYSYAWSNLETTEDISNLAPGNYAVVVTDSNACSASAQATINEPIVLTISGVDTRVKCYNEANGAIDITVSGGVLPYSYSWSNNEITEDVSGLIAGNYNVTVTDINGCVIGYSTTITQPDSLMIQTVVYDATCNTNNGSIQAQVSGGTTPYLYNWSNGTTDLNLNNVVAGTYTITVTDVNLCTAQFTGTINSISNLIAEVSSTDVLCFGGNNGDVDVFVTSGNAPYTYLWSTGDTTSLVNNLPIGSYNVTVTDIFGCQINHVIDVNQPDSLFIELAVSSFLSETNISLYGEDDGYINSTVFGGVNPYAYLWSNGSTEPEISGLVAGEYSLIVTDENGCLAYAKTKLIQPLVLEMPSGFSPNQDGSNDYFVVKGVEAYPRNEITVFNRWGNIVYQKANYNNEWEGKNQGGEPLPDATYFVVFTAFGNEDITLKGYVDLRR